MIDLLFALVAAAAAQDSGAGAPAPAAPSAALVAPVEQGTVTQGQNVQIGENVQIGNAALPAPLPAGPTIDDTVIPAGLSAEPQTPSGKFTTAAEVKPILTATKGNWVAVREYEGFDHLYVTHLWSWRCGLKAMAISVNDEPMQNWPLPPCHTQFATPNAILEEDGLPYLRLKLGGVSSVVIQIVYDDLSRDIARFDRGDILIP